ncbi:MAG: cytochrome c-type biogenesis protein [Pseudomonadales bacterium]|jgi:cytochrome c-type biogenesis protein CcmH
MVFCARSALLLALLVATASAALAAPRFDVFEFENPELERRYQGLIAELRCPKCLNTNLAGSDAPIAQDLRRTVHRLLTEEGLSDAEIRAWLQERYGDFVLYDPPFRPDTWVLWLAPLAFLIAGLLVLTRLLRQPAADPLSDAESARLRDLLERD